MTIRPSPPRAANGFAATGRGRRGAVRLGACLLGALLLAVASPAPARADAAADEAAIRAALDGWARDFNDRRTDKVCDLFAPELRFDYRGAPERGHAEICAQLKRALADDSRRMTNSAEIREVIVDGDLAVVRLIWTETVARAGKPDAVDRQTGLDVFRRQPDGSWKIVRFIAYGED